VQLRVSGLADQAPPALALVADLALNPAFADDEIARLKARRTDALLRQREDIGRTADVVARAAYYGPEHPLGASALGDEAAIAATTRAELQGFWRTHARPDRAALVVVGSLDEAAARRLAVQHFGGWKSPAEAAPAAAAAPAPRPTAAKLVLVDKPGASQTALQVVGPGPGADAPDAAAAEVMNNALGGLFTSRINHQLREVKGYTYGVYSRFAGGRSATHWTARGNVRGDVTAPALADLLAEVDGVRAAPLPGDELARARNASLLSLPGLFDTNDAVADRLAGAWSLGHPADFWARWPGRLAAVDAAAAQAAARAHVAPASLKIIAVGDLAKVRAPLEALQLGPVELRDADGRVKR
jgi:zinc protease